MDQAAQSNAFVSFVPMLVLGVIWVFPAVLLAKEKGHSPWLWGILAFVPLVNFACILYFIGATNRTLERKIDQLLERSV